jgi:hypothetical protein
MRNDIFKSLAHHIEGIQNMKAMEENNGHIHSVAAQYKCKKEELFEDMIFAIAMSNTDILNKLYAVVLGRRSFDIYPELDLISYLRLIQNKNAKERENSSNANGLKDFIEKLSDVLAKFDKLKQLEKFFESSELKKLKNKQKKSSDFEKLASILV